MKNKITHELYRREHTTLVIKDITFNEWKVYGLNVDEIVLPTDILLLGNFNEVLNKLVLNVYDRMGFIRIKDTIIIDFRE
jgi:hypothetical protein